MLVEVRSARVRPTRRRNLRIVEASVVDESGPMKAVWFNQAWIAEQLTPGGRVLLHGKLDRSGFRVDAYEIAGGEDAPSGLHTTGIVPVHPASERLRPARLREWAWQAVELAPDAIEPLPAELRARRRLPGVGDALRSAHFPASPAEGEAARRRLAFEELLLHQAALASRRGRRESARPGIRIADPGELVGRWLESLPFDPTGDQRRAFAEVDSDLQSGRPMQRLLMGEVGSGKTAVALHAMLRAVDAGYQAALMAPTETLAEQHAATLDRLLSNEPVPFALLTGATTAARRREALARLASGELPLVVGTHALLEPDVEFGRLALCVIDEQHRFGVRQRAALDAKGPRLADGSQAAPHALHLTATPIPRTLSLTAYGDLDATTLRELPHGRRPVKTWVVEEDRRAGAYGFIRDRLREGRQAFVVCPLVEGSEKLVSEGRRRGGRAPATGRAARLSRRPPPRPDAPAREGGGDGRVRDGRGRRPRRHHRDRGRDRRPERDCDADRGRRALRPLPAPPAPWSGRSRRPPVALHPVRRCRVAGREDAARGDRERARRVQARRGRPRPARRGRDPRHPPARPAPLPGRAAARRPVAPHRRPPRGGRDARAARQRSRCPSSAR